MRNAKNLSGAPGLIPWAWGVNGCTSVLSSILSVMTAVAFGFSWVLVGAAVAYGVALGAIYPLALWNSNSTGLAG